MTVGNRRLFSLWMCKWVSASSLGEPIVEHRVALTSIGCDHVAVGGAAEHAEQLTGALVLDEHHRDRVAQRAAVELRRRVSCGELADHREQHPFLFEHVGLEVAFQLVEEPTYRGEFGMSSAVLVEHLVGQPGESWKLVPQKCVVDALQMVDQRCRTELGPVLGGVVDIE